LCGARHGFMPIGVEVTTPAKFAQWVAQQGGHMPGATPPTGSTATAAAAQPNAGAPAAGNAPPAPAVPGTATANTAPAPNNKNVSNRTNQ
jgi:cytochrome c oxidase subunit 2